MNGFSPEKDPMDRPATTIRAAQPTYEEGLAFARYLDQAAEGFFRFMLGRRAELILARAFTQPDHDLSYQHVTFAERDDWPSTSRPRMRGRAGSTGVAGWSSSRSGPSIWPYPN